MSRLHAAKRWQVQHVSAMYLFTQELAQVTDLADLLAIAIREVGKAARADVALQISDETRDGTLTPYFASTWALDEKEQRVASWVFRRGRPAGRGTGTFPSAEGVHLPLIAGELAAGVLSVRPTDAATIAYAYSQQDLLEGFAREIALAIDRHRLRDAKQRAKMDQESEV